MMRAESRCIPAPLQRLLLLLLLVQQHLLHVHHECARATQHTHICVSHSCWFGFQHSRDSGTQPYRGDSKWMRLAACRGRLQKRTKLPKGDALHWCRNAQAVDDTATAVAPKCKFPSDEVGARPPRQLQTQTLISLKQATNSAAAAAQAGGCYAYTSVSCLGGAPLVYACAKLRRSLQRRSPGPLCAVPILQPRSLQCTRAGSYLSMLPIVCMLAFAQAAASTPM